MAAFVEKPTKSGFFGEGPIQLITRFSQFSQLPFDRENSTFNFSFPLQAIFVGSSPLRGFSRLAIFAQASIEFEKRVAKSVRELKNLGTPLFSLVFLGPSG